MLNFGAVFGAAFSFICGVGDYSGSLIPVVRYINTDYTRQ